MPHFLGVDVGGTNTRLMLMDSQQNFRGYHKTPTQSWAGQSDPLSGLEALIRGYLDAQDPHHQVAQVMLGLPGILSRDRQTVLSLPFISALDNQPVAEQLAQRLHLPVTMDKDVNHLMWWDLLQHDALPDVAVGLYLAPVWATVCGLTAIFIMVHTAVRASSGTFRWQAIRCCVLAAKPGVSIR